MDASGRCTTGALGAVALGTLALGLSALMGSLAGCGTAPDPVGGSANETGGLTRAPELKSDTWVFPPRWTDAPDRSGKWVVAAFFAPT